MRTYCLSYSSPRNLQKGLLLKFQFNFTFIEVKFSTQTIILKYTVQAGVVTQCQRTHFKHKELNSISRTHREKKSQSQ